MILNFISKIYYILDTVFVYQFVEEVWYVCFHYTDHSELLFSINKIF